ncbi:hypothetical protein GF336_02445 [Candidatus Woesearchaeota archaeon]|nr:hypothetical protein [Candidatus Woesearchaeota archaeon]
MSIIKLGDFRLAPETKDLAEFSEELAREDRYKVFFPNKQDSLPCTREEVDSFYEQGLVADESELRERYERQNRFYGLQKPIAADIRKDSLERFLRTEVNASLNVLKKELSPEEFRVHDEKKKYNIFLDKIYESKPCFLDPREELLKTFEDLNIIRPKYFRPSEYNISSRKGFFKILNMVCPVKQYNGLEILRKNI